MIEDFEFPYTSFLIILSALGCLIALKYFFYIKLRNKKSNRRFAKSFFRWYDESNINTVYDQPKRQKFMRVSNGINFFSWLLVLGFLLVIIRVIVSFFSDMS